MEGKVQTVLGPVDASLMGRTLVHEHLTHGLSCEVFKRPVPDIIKDVKCDFKSENLHWIRQYPYSWNENIEFDFHDDVVRSAVIKEMEFFKQVGGGTIVENSSVGLRNKDQHLFLKKLSEETGVHIISGTGFYVANSHSSSTLNLEVEVMETMMKEDLLTGICGTNIKCGLIGEIGCSWPLHGFEKRVLQAAASVQEQVHCPTIIHPGRNSKAPPEILRIFLEAGGRVNQTAIAHLERTIYKESELLELAEQGCYCEFDLFGTEISYYQCAEDLDMPSDAQRIALIHYLTQQGFLSKIVVSHDIHTKHRLMNYGGHGYSHILVNVVPYMLRRGFTQDDIDRFLLYNPRELLAFR